MASTSYLTGLIFGTQRTGLSFATPENTQAAQTLQDWANAGYFTPGFGGGGYDDSVSNFAKGQGLFMITGNWIVENLGADNTQFGFFPMPPMDSHDTPVATGGAGFPLSIAAGSDHPDAAAAYIDWMTSDHASDLLLQTGEIPLHNGKPPAVQPGTLLADVVNAARTVTDGNGVVPYEDWATPTFYDTLTSNIQELMVNRKHLTSSCPTSKPTTKTSRARAADGYLPERRAGRGLLRRQARTPAGWGDPKERLPGESRRIAYLYIAPAFVLYAAFNLWPLVQGVNISLFHWDGITEGTWAGLSNY